MGEKTPIEWCDSAINPVMGCDGCELWIPEKNIEHCYAGTLHKIRAGRPGYADRFDEPKIFPGRMAKAAAWSDMQGKDRPEKPWLNGMPRMIFVSDMGDALSRNVPLEYLRDEVIGAVRSDKGQRHLWLWLTKQPQRMMELYRLLAAHGLDWPANLWPGTSITSEAQTARIKHLLRVPAAVRFLSLEPLLDAVDLDRGRCDTHGREHIKTDGGEEFCNECSADGFSGELTYGHWLDACADAHQPGINWVIIGGESGPGARPFDLAWARSVLAQCNQAGVACFVKQLGANPVDTTPLPVDPAATPLMQEVLDGYNRGVAEKALARIKDRKGGDIAEFPEDLRVRQFPKLLSA